MNNKYRWLPVDERLIPDIFSFKYPKSKWVRLALFFEMFFAVIAVIGTLFLVLLPRTSPTNSEAQTTTTTQNTAPAYLGK